MSGSCTLTEKSAARTHGRQTNPTSRITLFPNRLVPARWPVNCATCAPSRRPPCTAATLGRKVTPAPQAAGVPGNFTTACSWAFSGSFVNNTALASDMPCARLASADAFEREPVVEIFRRRTACRTCRASTSRRPLFDAKIFHAAVL